MGSRKPLDTQLMARLRAEGQSLDDIACACGCCTNTVRNRLREQGLLGPSRPRSRTDVTPELVVSLLKGGLDVQEAAQELGVTAATVRGRAAAVGHRPPDRRRFWTPEKDEALLSLADDPHRAAEELGTSLRAVQHRLKCLEVGEGERKGPWSLDEEASLQALLDQGLSHQEAAHRLCRSLSSVSNRSALLNQEPGHDRRRIWSDEETELLVQLYERGGGAASIAEALGTKTVGQVRSKLARLKEQGLVETKELWTPALDDALKKAVGLAEPLTDQAVQKACARTGRTAAQVRSRVARLRKAEGVTVATPWTPEAEDLLLSLVRPNGTLSVKDADSLAGTLGLSRTAVQRHLADLRRKGQAPPVEARRGRPSRPRGPRTAWSPQEDVQILGLGFDGTAFGAVSRLAQRLHRSTPAVRNRAQALHDEAVACVSGELPWEGSCLSFLDDGQREAVRALVEAEASRRDALARLTPANGPMP